MSRRSVISVILAAVVVVLAVAGLIARHNRVSEQREYSRELYDKYMEELAQAEANATPAPEEIVYYTVFSDGDAILLDQPSEDDGREAARISPGSIVEFQNEIQDGYYKVKCVGTTVTGWLPAYYLKSAFVYSLSYLDIVDADSGNYTYSEMVQDISQLKDKYPDLLTYRSIGETSAGRSIYALSIGSEDADKDVLIYSGVRGCEYLTSLLVMKQAEYYLEYYNEGIYDGDTLYSDVFSEVRFNIVPMLNPDGVELSQGGLDSVEDEDVKQELEAIYSSDRLNDHGSRLQSTYFRQWGANLDGVDLYYNFPDSTDGFGVDHPSYIEYPGDKTSNEAKALMSLTEDLEDSLVFTMGIYERGDNINFYYDKNNDLDKYTAKIAMGLSDLSLYAINTSPEAEITYHSYYAWARYQKLIPSVILRLGDTEKTSPLPLSELQQMWLKLRESWMDIGKTIISLDEGD